MFLQDRVRAPVRAPVRASVRMSSPGSVVTKKLGLLPGDHTMILLFPGPTLATAPQCAIAAFALAISTVSGLLNVMAFVGAAGDLGDCSGLSRVLHVCIEAKCFVKPGFKYAVVTRRAAQ